VCFLGFRRLSPSAVCKKQSEIHVLSETRKWNHCPTNKTLPIYLRGESLFLTSKTVIYGIIDLHGLPHSWLVWQEKDSYVTMTTFIDPATKPKDTILPHQFYRHAKIQFVNKAAQSYSLCPAFYIQVSRRESYWKIRLVYYGRTTQSWGDVHTELPDVQISSRNRI
jgi:hypothetical protein